MTRLIRADLLKLRRRRGMVGVVGLFVFASVALYYGVGLVLHATDASRPLMGGIDSFDNATGVLGLLASVAGAIIGATAAIDGLEATRRLPRDRVLVLTTFGLDEYIVEALRAARAAS